MNSGPAAAEILEEPVDDIDETREVIPYVYSITAYGADYPVDSLVKRIRSGDVVIPRFSWQDEASDITGFQREYVWPRSKSDRFIESLLLGLPVPGIFLVKEPSGRFLVLDGHQRLHTLQSFYGGEIHGKIYRLDDVETRFRKKRYEDLDVEDRRRLDDSIIHATVIRQDEPTEDQSSVYMIFERLNTGGVNLQPQEIRVALYHGELVRVLRQLNELPAWRNLYGKRSHRLKDIELILRFFAFCYRAGDYKSPMKEFPPEMILFMQSRMSKNRASLRTWPSSTSGFLLPCPPLGNPRYVLPATMIHFLWIFATTVAPAVHSPNAAQTSFSRTWGIRRRLKALKTLVYLKGAAVYRLEAFH